MRADQDRSARTRELPLASRFDSSLDSSLAHGETVGFGPAEHDEHLAPEFVSQLVDVSQELADVIASANADVE